jgi:uncharacterized protein DUF4255
MTLGVLDLSVITDRVIQELETAKGTTQLWKEEPTDGTPLGVGKEDDRDPTGRFTVEFTGLPPQEARKLSGCQVSLYLFHVTPNATYRNSFPLGGRPRTIPEQPLALTLYYLLSAHSPNSYIEEQQAMSIALKCLHDHPIMSAIVPIDRRLQEFTLTMESQSVDEIGRLWLSLAAPLGLSAVYRASVIFIEPEPPPATQPPKIVLEPHVTAIPFLGEIKAALTSAPTNTDTATVTGAGFDERTISLTIGGLDFTVVPTPAAGAPPALGPGEARVVSPTQLELRLPSGASPGRYVLQVRLTGDGPVYEVQLELDPNLP